MMLIAHRGNTEGRMPNLENNPSYVDKAIKEGFPCEIDLRTHNGKLYLGHDAPQYEISVSWLKDRVLWLWVHCKDRESLETALNSNLHCFWHDTDDYTITNRGYVWAYPGKMPAGPLTIMVMPEYCEMLDKVKDIKPFGVCSDFVKQLKA
jgi:hypothetical protein